MKKRVENENIEVSTSNNDGSDVSGGFHTKHRRASLSLKKLRVLLKFLLFREDEPKHSVCFDLKPIYLAMILPFAPILAVAFVLVGYVFFGIVGAFITYIIAIVLALEVPHCIFDR